MLAKNTNTKDFFKAAPVTLLDKAEGDGKGNNITAVITTFNDPDKGGDIFMPDSFDKYLKEFNDEGRPVQMAIAHDKTIVAGEWHTLTKTATGITAEGVIFDDLEDGKRAKKLLERGIAKDVSMGIKSKGFAFNELGGVTHIEAALREVSLVTNPQNPNANILTVKSEQPAYVPTELDIFNKSLGDYTARFDNHALVNHIDAATANLTK